MTGPRFELPGLVPVEVARRLVADDVDPAARPIARARRRVNRWRAASIRRAASRAEERGAATVECTLCGWKGAAFRPTARESGLVLAARCPGCGSRPRHRLLGLAWRSSRRPPPGPCLHVAPEPCLAGFWRDGPTIGLDLALATDLRGDVERLPVRPASLSLVMVGDVLEHVVDDLAALRSLRAAVRSDALVVLHVPVTVTETLEWGHARDSDHGHRRAYGPDVVDRIAAAGFEPGVTLTTQLDDPTRRRHGLERPDVLFLATPC